MSIDYNSAVEKARAVAAKLSQGITPAIPSQPSNTSGVNYTHTINNESYNESSYNGSSNGASLKRQIDDDDIVSNLKKMAYSNSSSVSSGGGSDKSQLNNKAAQQLLQQRSSNGNTIFKPTQIYLEGVIINGEKILDCLLPGNKVGFVIGKNGDMIRQLQERANVKMVVIQQSSEISENQKQLRISGDPSKVDYAHQLVKDLLVEKEMEMLKYSQKPNKGHSNHSNNMEYGSMSRNYLEIPVSPQFIGLVIGKGGENIKRISQETGAKVTVDVSKADQTGNKLCQITASNPSSLNMAADMVRDILSNAVNNKRTPQPGSEEVKISVPQNKTGIVIGKGGETIRALKQQAGCNIELEKNSKGIFYIRGPADRIAYAQQLIGDKIGGQVTVLTSTIQNNQQTASAAASAYSADPYAWSTASQYGYPQISNVAGSTGTPSATSAAGATAQDPNAAWAAYCSQYYSQMQQMAQLPGVTSATAAAAQISTATTTPAATAQPTVAATATADGTEDYSAQWAAYYRYYGMEKEAEMYEQMAKQKKQAAANPST